MYLVVISPAKLQINFWMFVMVLSLPLLFRELLVTVEQNPDVKIES